MPSDPPLVETRVAYKDYGSIEASTNRERDKFKLAGNSLPEIGVYSFFIVNSSDSALIKKITILVNKEDWEDRVENELDHDFSYIDISDCIQLTKGQIIEKREDPNNRFPPIARLCQLKFDKLRKIAKDLRSPSVICRVPREIRGYICSALGVSDELKRKLGL